MMPSKVAAVVIAVALAFPLVSHAAEIAGVQIEESQQVDGQELVLNGAGLRSRAFFKVYIAALYVTKKTGSAAQVLDAATPTRMSLRMMRSLDADQLITALNEGVADNVSQAELASLQGGLRQLADLMRKVGATKAGDLVSLDFKGESVIIGFNGTHIGSVTAPRLGRALLSIWLGEHPIDTGLKKSLLGI